MLFRPRRVAEALLRLFAILIAPLLRAMAMRGIGSEQFLARGVLPVPLHFYQPIFDPGKLPQSVWRRKTELPGINFDPAGQLAFLAHLADFAAECAWPEHATGDDKYYCQNPSFGYSSACLLHCVVRRFAPKTVIEVGAGMSTLVLSDAMDANERESGHRGDLVTIDPYPTPTVQAISPTKRRLIAAEVQATSPHEFAKLGAGDLLFIDSSHVVRTGGDVNFLYLDVLPRLASGVVVHIHDIQLPYEYHRAYSAPGSRAGFYWTEQYLLQAFLALNSVFRVLLAGYWAQLDHSVRFAELFPTWRPSEHRPTTSFYMQRC